MSVHTRLQWGGCLELYCWEQYDAIYSYDVFLHISNNARLLERLNEVIRSDGSKKESILYISDIDLHANLHL